MRALARRMFGDGYRERRVATTLRRAEMTAGGARPCTRPSAKGSAVNRIGGWTVDDRMNEAPMRPRGIPVRACRRPGPPVREPGCAP